MEAMKTIISLPLRLALQSLKQARKYHLLLQRRLFWIQNLGSRSGVRGLYRLFVEPSYTPPPYCQVTRILSNLCYQCFYVPTFISMEIYLFCVVTLSAGLIDGAGSLGNWSPGPHLLGAPWPGPRGLEGAGALVKWGWSSRWVGLEYPSGGAASSRLQLQPLISPVCCRDYRRQRCRSSGAAWQPEVPGHN